MEKVSGSNFSFLNNRSKQKYITIYKHYLDGNPFCFCVISSMFSSLTCFILCHQHSLFFLFSTPTASHTLTVQYSISVPSFPNVRARNSPQEQDEEQWVWDRWACWLRSDTDVWECQTLQCSSLVHLQACTQTPAHSAGQSQCTLVIVVVVLRGIRTIWLMYVCIYTVYIAYYLSRWRERSFCREMMMMETACSLLPRLTPVAQKEKGLHFVAFCFLNL